MACSSGSCSVEIIRPCNIWTLEDAEQFFSSAGTSIKSVSPEKVEEYLACLENTGLSEAEKSSMAALTKYVGVGYLDEDNPVQALKFFQHSCQCYENLDYKNQKVSTEMITDLEEEAHIYVNLCLVRNHDRLADTAQVLSLYQSEKLTAKNGALLYIAIEELKNLHNVDTELYLDLETEDFEENTLFRVHSACEFLIDSGFVQDFDECWTEQDDRLLLAKMLIRCEVDDEEIHERCAELIRQDCHERGIENSCSLAHVLYAKGKRLCEETTTISAEKAAKECFETCLAIRQEKLGDNHVQTAKTKFQIGRLNFLHSLSEDAASDPKHYAMMENALHILEQHSDGCFLECIKSAETMAELLLANGFLQQSLDIFERCSQLILNREASVFDDTYYLLRVWTRMGEIQMECKRYRVALGWFVKVSDRLEIDCLIQTQASAKLYTAQLTYNRQMESAKSESTSMLVWTRILGVKFRLGLLHEINDAPQTAEKYYLEALEICHENRIFCHPVLFDTNFHLAEIYLKQKKVAECEKFAKKSLEMSLRLFDPNEGQVESVFDIFKQLVEYRKNVRKASFVFTSYMDTFSRLGVADQSVFLASFGYTFAKRMFEEIMSEESELKKCRDLFAKSCDVFRKSFGRKDEKTVDSQKMMGLCHLRLGNVRLAEWHLFNAAVALQN